MQLLSMMCPAAQALGRYLLQDVDRGRFAGEAFIACQQLHSPTDYAVLTAGHLLCIHSPGLRFLPSLNYCIALEDILLLRRCACACPATPGHCWECVSVND